LPIFPAAAVSHRRLADGHAGVRRQPGAPARAPVPGAGHHPAAVAQPAADARGRRAQPAHDAADRRTDPHRRRAGLHPAAVLPDLRGHRPVRVMQMGLGYASMRDPANGVSVPLLGQFLLNMATLMFLAMNGHLVVFEVLAESFATLPVGGGFLVGHYGEIAGKLTWVLGSAVLIALPA